MEQKILRRLRKEDASRIAELVNNKNIWDNLRDFIPYPYSDDDADFFINLTLNEEVHQTFGILNDQKELCGVISVLVQADVYSKSAEIGFWIGEPHWGKGLATKAIKEITKYGFQELKLERIYAGVFESNKGSMKALEKNGYHKEAIFKNAIIKNGKICDEHRFAMLKDKFLS